jgi:hypothetical protein
VPFTLLRGDLQAVHGTPTVVKFKAPAPASAFLRFAGIGSAIDVSLDGGKTWQPAQKQVQKLNYVEHFSNYWTPIPKGTSSVTIRGRDFRGGPWWVRDVAVWSKTLTTQEPHAGQPAPPAKVPVTPPAVRQTTPVLNAIMTAVWSPVGLSLGIAVLGLALVAAFGLRLLIRRRRARLRDR